jgi:hypothetical protein
MLEGIQCVTNAGNLPPRCCYAFIHLGGIFHDQRQAYRRERITQERAVWRNLKSFEKN